MQKNPGSFIMNLCKYVSVFSILISLKSYSQNDSWTSLTSSSSSMKGRTGAVSFSIGDKGYIATGSNTDGLQKDLWEFDPATSSFSQKADFAGTARANAIGFSIGSKGYIGTGSVAGEIAPQANDFWEYDVPANQWTRKKDLPGAGRSNAVGLAVNGKGYITTGYNGSSLMGDCWEYDPANDSWTEKASAIPRYGAIGFTIGKKFYIGLGATKYPANATNNSSDLFEFDPVQNKWTSLAQYPGAPAAFAVSFALNGSGYVGTGLRTSYSYPFNEWFEYNPLTNYWTEHLSVPGDQIVSATSFTIGSNAYLGFHPNASGQPVIFKYHVNVNDSLKVLYTGRSYSNLDWGNFNHTESIVTYDVYINDVVKYTSKESAITISNLSASTSYNVKVIGKDEFGNSYSPSNTVVVKTTEGTNGLNYRYYEGNWTKLPNFNQLTPVNTGIEPYLDLTQLHERPFLAANVWEGFINIPTPGTYTFENISDDGSRFYFNSFYTPDAVPLVDNDGIHPVQTVKASINIPVAGRYPVAITFFQSQNSELCETYWSGPGMQRQYIPPSAYIGTGRPPNEATPPSVPNNLTILGKGRNFVNLDWYDSYSPITDSILYDIYVNGVKKYTSKVSAIIADGLDDNTSYVFTVSARDLAGNSSLQAVAVSATTGVSTNGLGYRYYEGDWDMLPDFTTLTPIKSGNYNFLDLGAKPTTQTNHFAMLWEGTLTVPYPGTYTFETVSDDGSKFYFNTVYTKDAVPLINNDGLHAPVAVRGTVDIPVAGRYPIAASFFQKDGGADIKVFWTGPAGSGIDHSFIPSTAFTEDFKPTIADIKPNSPVNVQVLGSPEANNVGISWGNPGSTIGLRGYDIYVNGILKYSTTQNNVLVSNLLSNTSYTLTVKAVNLYGTSSEPSDPLQVKTAYSSYGIDYFYYEGDWDMLPDFSKLVPIRIGSTPGIDINATRTPGRTDHFAFVFEGYINVPTPGDYTFETVSDDGSKLYIDTFYYPNLSPLVDNDGLHPAIASSGTIHFFTAGPHKITVTFFEKDGDEKLEVYWTGPGLPRQMITTPYYVRGEPAPTGLVMNSTATTTLSIQSESAGLNIKFYPNPFSKSFQLSINNSSTANNIEVGIYDLTGRLVLNKKFDQLPAGNNTLIVALEGKTLGTGVYVVHVKVNGKLIKTGKIVKAR